MARNVYSIRSCAALKGPAIIFERKDLDLLTASVADDDDAGTLNDNGGGDQWKAFPDVTKALEYLQTANVPSPLVPVAQAATLPLSTSTANPLQVNAAAVDRHQPSPSLQENQQHPSLPTPSLITTVPPSTSPRSKTNNKKSAAKKSASKPASIADAPSSSSSSFHSANSRWNERFQELFNFKMKHGHCNVSARSDTDKKLGEWVRTQRRRKNGKGSKFLKPLSEEEESKLKAIGFDWRCPSKPEWEDRYKELIKFKQIYGHVHVPRDYTENPALGGWCVMQRKRKRQNIARAYNSQPLGNKFIGASLSFKVGTAPVQDPLMFPDGAAALHHPTGDEGDSSSQQTAKKPKKPSPLTREQEQKLLGLGFEF